MDIEKSLKSGVSFKWKEVEKQLWLITPVGQAVLTKTQMFSLFRFIIRISQRLSQKRRKSKSIKREVGDGELKRTECLADKQ